MQDTVIGLSEASCLWCLELFSVCLVAVACWPGAIWCPVSCICKHTGVHVPAAPVHLNPDRKWDKARICPDLSREAAFSAQSRGTQQPQ